MPASGTRLLGRFGISRRYPVEFSSPYPADECLRRLAEVTTGRGATSWYLDSRTVGRGDPRLRGEVAPYRIWVARWQDAAGRNSYAPWLELRLEPAAGGGTLLTGTIGLHPATRAVSRLVAGVASLIGLAGLAGGVSLVARGHLSGLVPVLLFPLLVTAIVVGFNTLGLRSFVKDAPKLIEEMNGILGSTTFPGAVVSRS